MKNNDFDSNQEPQQYSYEDIVRALYRGVLRRNPDPRGLETNIAFLRGRSSRSGDVASLIRAFLASTEYQGIAVRELAYRSVSSRQTEDVISAMALAQMSYWIFKKPVMQRSLEDYSRKNNATEHTFLYHFRRGYVTVADKPQYSADQVAAGIDTNTKRAGSYLKFFNSVRLSAPFPLLGTIAMSMHDGPNLDPNFPYFAFQKPQGGVAILLPDIDAINSDFYLGKSDDTTAYHDKLNSAIFIGATTGGRHTRESVAALTNQRLRSGVFFRDVPEVDFRLPKIVGCSSSDVEKLIRGLGFGAGVGTWDDQFAHKFLISMDGNGATCSRVAIALKSNSVLVKYGSNNELYYFSAMRPYVDYFPVRTDEDVVRLVRAEKRRPGAHETIAHNGREFFREFLTMAPAIRYTAEVLKSYFSVFDHAEWPV